MYEAMYRVADISLVTNSNTMMCILATKSNRGIAAINVIYVVLKYVYQHKSCRMHISIRLNKGFLFCQYRMN
jgi:hypothetical protein